MVPTEHHQHVMIKESTNMSRSYNVPVGETNKESADVRRGGLSEERPG